jgi:sorting nexin-1/2
MVNKVANHPELANDEDLKLFLESEDFGRDVKVRDAIKGPVPTPEAKTWMGWSGTVGINSGQKFHEHDEWFDQQRAYLDSLEAQLKQMVKSLNTLAQTRKGEQGRMMLLRGASRLTP